MKVAPLIVHVLPSPLIAALIQIVDPRLLLPVAVVLHHPQRKSLLFQQEQELKESS